MTPLSRQILEDFQIRKTKKQKDAFIHLLQESFPNMQIQVGGFPRCRNLIIGDIARAKMILSAHYDTCARLPFPNFIAPKNIFLSLLYSVLITVPLFAAVILANLLLNLITQSFLPHYCLSLAIFLLGIAMMILGPANPNTANDNTSGVITLCELLGVLNDREKEDIAFVFFDHEEIGLIGSSLFRSRYKNQLHSKLLINFDCVSDGDTMMLAVSKKARKTYWEALDRCFRPTESKGILITRLEKTYYPSDQAGFPNSVAVAALKRKPILGYYMDRIHTKKDTNFDPANIKLLCESTREFIKDIRSRLWN